ncbi:MAG TPA: hypothetical protein VIL42_11445 [Sphingomicrobium sp.]|jgi:hypothetical protein
MEHPRTQSARENDDSDIIDNAEPGPDFGGSYGGNMQRDIASAVELARVEDPEAREGSDKQHDIDHAQRYENDHPADQQQGDSA